MKMMKLETTSRTIEVINNVHGSVEAVYSRSRDLTFSVRVIIRPALTSLKQFASDKETVVFAERHSVLPIITCLNKLTDFLFNLGGHDTQLELVGIALNALRSRKAKDYINGQIPRRIVNARVAEACNAQLRPFEQNENFRWRYANLIYRIWHAEVVDLEGRGKPDFEQIALVFVKTSLGFNLGLDYRFTKADHNTMEVGRILLSKHQPETVSGLYALVVKGLNELVVQDRISEEHAEILIIRAETMFIDDENDIEEILYRHHTLNI